MKRILPNEKVRCIIWFSRTKGTAPPFLFELITLITHLFSFLLFVCLACPWADLYLHTLTITTFPARVLAYQHTWFCLFLFHQSFCHQSFLRQSFFSPKFFSLLPPLSLGLLTHFSLLFSLTTLFTCLNSFSQLAFLPACCCCAWASVLAKLPVSVLFVWVGLACFC